MKILLSVFAIAFFATTAFAYLGQIVASFPSPADPYTWGLARSGTYLFALDSSARRVYRCRPNTGSIYGSWSISYSGAFRGLAYSSGNYIWVGDTGSENRIYKINALNGSVYGRFRYLTDDPFGLAPRCTGDGGTGTTHLFASDNSPARVYQHDINSGSIMAQFVVTHPSTFDCTYDWRNAVVWLPEINGRYIYAYRPGAGQILGSFRMPVPSCVGLAYYGEYLWVASRSPSPDRIYRVHCPRNFVWVSPSSMGKVKALFK
jgi:sugar lactone lactonase YvrE